MQMQIDAVAWRERQACGPRAPGGFHSLGPGGRGLQAPRASGGGRPAGGVRGLFERYYRRHKLRAQLLRGAMAYQAPGAAAAGEKTEDAR